MIFILIVGKQWDGEEVPARYRGDCNRRLQTRFRVNELTECGPTRYLAFDGTEAFHAGPCLDQCAVGLALQGGARPGIQFTAGAARGLRRLYHQPAPRRLGVRAQGL